jgi:signal peptide peptidase SppA
MTVLEILNSPWAIIPDRLLQIQGIYARRLDGEDPDLPGIEARIGRPLTNQPAQGYEILNGAALIPLQGVLGQRMNLMTNMSGGTSTQLFARDVQAAAADPAVQSIVLVVDSPGGTVAGTQAAADAVRGVKPIGAYVQGQMASAAAWIGTAADVVAMDSTTAQAGSIGVVATHTDVSKQQEAMGIKTTEIVAGKYKRIASQYGPLTETGAQAMQDQVDYLYSLFVADVAANRGVTPETVLAQMADGRMFIGQQAIDAGLVDRITSLDALIADLNASAIQSQPTLALAVSPMDPRELAASWAAENPESAAVLRAEGAISERDRIAAVRSVSLPGHEALIETLAADGHTSGEQAAVLVVAAENERQKQAATLRLSDAVAPLSHAEAPEPMKAVEPKSLDPQRIARRAQQIVATEEQAGNRITVTEACAMARQELDSQPSAA